MEIAIKILERAIAQRELGNKTVPNHLRLKQSLQEIESLTKAVSELKNLHKANVIKSVCTCIAFHKSDECYKLGCKAHRSDEVQTVL